MSRLTRNCKIDTTNIAKENKELVSMLPNYDYTRNELGFAISNDQQCLDKLGQLEDILECHKIEDLKELDGLLRYVKQIKNIEDYLGIDLITVSKAYHNGFYIKYAGGLVGYIRGGEIYLEACFDTKCFKVKAFVPDGSSRWYFKDYGKTWALTRGEITDEKEN